ncbi:hypothetical protein N7465_010031 [Penicillium sp. CMV-2018d]|nr:hypothetical protein N7465_010031 [Penicillium sp. CMV-2018d]
MAAYWHNDLFQLVGSDSVLFVILMTGTCCIRGKLTYSRMSLPIARLQAMSYDAKGVVKNALLKYPPKYLLRLTFSSSRAWLFQLLQSVAMWVADAEATQATETEKKRLRAQVTGLGQQIRGTEGQTLAVLSNRQSQQKSGDTEPELGSQENNLASTPI